MEHWTSLYGVLAMDKFSVTVWNKYFNPTTRFDEWKRTVINGVQFVASKGSNVMRSGMTDVDAVRIIVPMSVIVEGKEYKSPKEWAKVPNVDMGKYFTFQSGDKIAKGVIDYEIVSPNTVADLEKKYDNVFTITNIDTCDFGSIMLRHWEIGGK